MLDYTVLQLIQMGTHVPREIKPYILSKYGLFTMRDFDKYFQLNDVLGKPYDNCYASIMSLKHPIAYYKCLSAEGNCSSTSCTAPSSLLWAKSSGCNTRHSADDFF